MELPPELVARAHTIRLCSKKISKAVQSGLSASTKRGNGFYFDQLRDYDLGDDIRFIDWKASARTSSMLVKQFYEDKIKQIVVVVDTTASARFGSQDILRERVIKLCGGLLMLAAGYANDMVGLIVVGQTTYSAPVKNGISYAYRCIDALMHHPAGGNFQDLTIALNQVTRGKSSLIFFISDMLIENIETTLSSMTHNHEVRVIRCLDQLERDMLALPIGLTMIDPETGKNLTLNSRAQHTNLYNKFHAQRLLQDDYLKNHSIPVIDIDVTNNALDQLMNALQK